MSNLTKFNIQTDNFLNELHRLYPDRSDVNIFYEKFKLLKSTNPRKIIENFTSYIYPYKQQIFDMNEQFFINDMDSTKAVEEAGGDEYCMNRAIDFKNLWKNDLSDTSKTTIWTYFKVLTVLAERYILEYKESQSSN